MKNGNFIPDSDLPPGLSEMFINSTDTLRHREINQAIPNTWNDRPPLFFAGRPKRRNFLWNKEENPEAENVDDTELENPNLLKGVSCLRKYKFSITLCDEIMGSSQLHDLTILRSDFIRKDDS